MTTNPEQTVGDEVSAVEEGVAPSVEENGKPTPKKKAPSKRKKATAKSKRPKRTAEPVEPLPTAEELAAELKENVIETKEQFVEATVEPAKKVVATWSVFAEMAKETLSGLAGGFLGNKKRKD